MVNRTLPIASSSEAGDELAKAVAPQARKKDDGHTGVQRGLENRDAVVLNIINVSTKSQPRRRCGRSRLATACRRQSRIPSTCAGASSFQHCRGPGRAAWHACSAAPGWRGHRRLFARVSNPKAIPGSIQPSSIISNNIHQLIIHMLAAVVCRFQYFGVVCGQEFAARSVIEANVARGELGDGHSRRQWQGFSRVPGSWCLNGQASHDQWYDRTTSRQRANQVSVWVRTIISRMQTANYSYFP